MRRLAAPRCVKALPQQRLLFVTIWILLLDQHQAAFTEELMLSPQPDGTILAHFDFNYEVTNPEDIIPAKIKALLNHQPVQELHLAFVLGRWFADRWGPPAITVTPPGATLQARFQPFEEQAELQQAWGNLTHALSGLFCASLNFLVSFNYLVAVPPYAALRVADASMVSMPSHPFGHTSAETGSPWLYGSLPKEAVCTENLTPWLKLLPCQGRQGLTQLLDRPTLYAASFHSMQVHLTVLPEDTSYTDNTANKSCMWQSTRECKAQSRPSFRPFSLQQTLTILIRPHQLHGQHPPGQLLGWGPPLQQNLTLQRLFNVPAVAACPKALHTHIYWQLPKSLYTSLYPDSLAWNASALHNELYTFSPTPDAVISSSDSLFALYNLTASDTPSSRNITAEGLSNSSDGTAAASSDSSNQHTSSLQTCIQPSLTWHQQPAPWDPPVPPVRVQQLLAGRLGDRGTLVLQIGFRLSEQQAAAHQTGSSRISDVHDQQSAGEEQQDNVSSGQDTRRHDFCIFQMVPWHFQLLFHTLKLHVDGQETKLSSVVTAHTLQPAEGQGTSALIELCLRLPGSARSAKLSIAFQKAFLTVFDHPPDANRGFDMPSALVTNLHAQPLHQAPWIMLQQAGADPKGSQIEQHHILHQLSTFSGQHVCSNGILVPMPTPDFSMPYNVCCLSCTVLALYVMGINAAVFSKPEHKTDVKQNMAARRRQLVSVLLLVVTFASLAVSTDKALQRQLKSALGLGSDE